MLSFLNENIELVKVLTPVFQTFVAIGGFMLALNQFKNSLNQSKSDLIWRQNEFVANKFREFFDNFDVKNALKIIDWKLRTICLVESDSKKTKVDRNMLKAALKNSSHYSSDEALVRDTFDEFFTRLGNFENYIQTGVILEYHLRPYLNYWMDLLHAKRPTIIDSETVDLMWSFIEEFGFHDTQKLLLRFGERPKKLE